MKKIAVIVAAGSGSRMNSPVPKQFLEINNKPLLFYTIDAFLKAYKDLSVILVLSKEHIDQGENIIDLYFDRSRIRICEGGKTRFQSVKNGLSNINEECIIFVHDGVRCLLTGDLIHRCYECAAELGSAIPVINSKDSVRLLTRNASKAVNRSEIKLVQTPQTFHSKILLAAFKVNFKERFTDEATVVEDFGLKINLVDGEENNIKITTPEDLSFAVSKLGKQ